jgi:hypothetical protein
MVWPLRSEKARLQGSQKTAVVLKGHGFTGVPIALARMGMFPVPCFFGVVRFSFLLLYQGTTHEAIENT